jgi:hypothetical protein
MRTKQQGADLSTAISGTMETPMCAPTTRRLEKWPPSKNDAGVEAGAVAGGDRSFAEAVSIAEKKKRIEAQIGETKRRSTSVLVLFGATTIPPLQDGKRRRPFGRNDNSSRENAQSGPTFANDEDKTPTRSHESA